MFEPGLSGRRLKTKQLEFHELTVSSFVFSKAEPAQAFSRPVREGQSKACLFFSVM